MRVNPTLAMTSANHGGKTLVAVAAAIKVGETGRSCHPTRASERKSDQQAQSDGQRKERDGPREDAQDQVVTGSPAAAGPSAVKAMSNVFPRSRPGVHP